MKTKFQGIVGILLLLGALPALQAGDGLAALKLNGPSAKPEIFERVEIPVSGVPTVANPFDPDLIALDLEVKSSSGNLRSIDPCQHLISSSFTGGSVRPGLYSRSEMDFAQYHSYNEKHPAQMTAEKTRQFYEQYRKPFFVSEYGTDWKGWKPDTDPHFRALHQAIWSGAFTGAVGTGMTWWWESIHTGNLYSHWSALSAFLAGTGMGRADLRPVPFQNIEGSVTPFGVAARDEAFVWLLNRAYDWPNGAMEANPAALEGAKVTLPNLADGLWSIEWWDTLAGKHVSTIEATASGGFLQLIAPAFKVDIAARLKKR